MDKNQQVEEQEHFQRNKNRLQDRHTFCESAPKTGVTEYSSEYARGNGNNEVRARLKAEEVRMTKTKSDPLRRRVSAARRNPNAEKPAKSCERLEKALAYQGSQDKIPVA